MVAETVEAAFDPADEGVFLAYRNDGLSIVKKLG
jgi:hypothetical protein